MAYVVIGLEAAFFNVYDRLVVKLELAYDGGDVVTRNRSCASRDDDIKITVYYLEGILDNVSEFLFAAEYDVRLFGVGAGHRGAARIAFALSDYPRDLNSTARTRVKDRYAFLYGHYALASAERACKSWLFDST